MNRQTGDTIFTIGHSTRTLAEFVALLRQVDVTRLVDVRSLPWSRMTPQFNTDTLPGALAAEGIGYRHLGALGGRRHHRQGAPPSLNMYWRVAAFRNYADYAETDEFRAGLQALRELARGNRAYAVPAIFGEGIFSAGVGQFYTSTPPRRTGAMSAGRTREQSQEQEGDGDDREYHANAVKRRPPRMVMRPVGRQRLGQPFRHRDVEWAEPRGPNTHHARHTQPRQSDQPHLRRSRRDSEERDQQRDECAGFDGAEQQTVASHRPLHANDRHGRHVPTRRPLDQVPHRVRRCQRDENSGGQ